MITYTILGVPYYSYSRIHPKNPILVIKAPLLFSSLCFVSLRLLGVGFEVWTLRP